MRQDVSMVQKVLIILTALVALIINMAQAKAQLSTNPWLEANDEEAIAEVYEKQNRRSRQQNRYYIRCEIGTYPLQPLEKILCGKRYPENVAI